MSQNTNKEVASLSSHDYMIFFDDVRVDQFVTNWSCNVSATGDYGEASITTIYVPDFDKIIHKPNSENIIQYRLKTSQGAKSERAFYIDDGIENMTNVRIFMKNIFSGRFVQVFEGVLRGKNSGFSKGQRTLTFMAYDYMNWLNRIICPWSIAINDAIWDNDMINWAAYGIDAVAAKSHYATTNETNGRGMSIAQALNKVILYTYLNNAFMQDDNSVMAWDQPLFRLTLMGDISEKLRNENFWGYTVQTQATHVDTFYLKLQNILQNLMFEYFQDRDGLIRIKPAFWNSDVLKNSIIDSSMIISLSDSVNWNNFYTRVVCTGGTNQVFDSANTGISQTAMKTQTPTAVATFNGQVITQKTIASTNSAGGDSVVTTASGRTTISSRGYMWPVPGFWTITQQWHDPSNVSHSGIDIAGNQEGTGSGVEGSAVVAAKDGEVLYAVRGHVNDQGSSGTDSYGNFVKLKHSDGACSLYAHLSSVSVNQGQRVTQGQTIGAAGNTGNSYGAHLHFEIRVDASTGDTVNPLSYVTNDPDSATGQTIDVSSFDRTGAYENAPTIGYDQDNDVAREFLLQLNEIEKRYGPNIHSTSQPMINIENAESLYASDSSNYINQVLTNLTGQDTDTEGQNYLAYDALSRYARFYLNYLNSSSNFASATTLPMPWLRPGTNVWLDPAGIDKVFYVNSVSHSGTKEGGCRTSLNLSIGRLRENFLDGTVVFGSKKTKSEDVFINEIYQDITTYGDVVKDYDAIRNMLQKYHQSSTPKNTISSQNLSELNGKEYPLRDFYISTDTAIKNVECHVDAAGDFIRGVMATASSSGGGGTVSSGIANTVVGAARIATLQGMYAGINVSMSGYSGKKIDLTYCGQFEYGSQSTFIKEIAPIAQFLWKKYHIVLPSIMIAQGGEETGWGGYIGRAQSQKNLFGMTNGGVQDGFRGYSSWEDSCTHYQQNFLNNIDLYYPIIGNTDYKDVAKHLEDHYCPEPQYPSHILTHIAQNNLTQYDMV